MYDNYDTLIIKEAFETHSVWKLCRAIMKSLRIIKWSFGIFEPIARRPMWNVSLSQASNIKKYLGKDNI